MRGPFHEFVSGVKPCLQLAGLKAQGDGQVRLAHAGRAEQQDVIAALEIPAGGQLADQRRSPRR
jgi:hypothetical protein